MPPASRQPQIDIGDPCWAAAEGWKFEQGISTFPRGYPSGIQYRTSPLDQDMEVTGPATLHLYAALDRPEATWFVTINDLAPDGTTRLVTQDGPALFVYFLR